LGEERVSKGDGKGGESCGEGFSGKASTFHPREGAGAESVDERWVGGKKKWRREAVLRS